MKLGLIVEGHGEVQALPTLVTRILNEKLTRHDVILHHPAMRVKRGKFADRFDDFERALKLLAGPNDAILVVLDADDDDPFELATGLQARAASCIGHRTVHVVPAVKEYEAWFLASLDSLNGQLDVLAGSTLSSDPESIRGAKGVFESFLQTGTYSETVDQKKYSAKLDIELARRNSPSFARLVDALAAMP